MQELRGQIKECRLVMQKLRSRRDAYGMQKYDETRDRYLKLLEKQEVYWKQRSKQFWLCEGDQNNNFFHKYATGRRKQNQITKLQDSTGEWQDSKEGIQGVIVDYFAGLFKSSEISDELSDHEVVQQVSARQNEKLTKQITRDEVKHAAFSMHPDKSPGIDGLNPCFFQTYWNVVGDDVVRCCQNFMATGELPCDVNKTIVCLIPKTKQPQKMTDLRPISLCNVLIRIVSKVMANRLKDCLAMLISDKQSAFVEGRLLTDNALVAFELNHYIRRKRQGANGVVGFKIDVSKAYDRLE